MEIVEKKPMPIYEAKCFECGSKIRYRASDVSLCHITCPVCGISLWASTITPVEYRYDKEDEK